MGDPGTIHCSRCGSDFSYEAMLPLADPDEVNTQVHHLVGGRCPSCEGPVEVSFAEIQETAISAED